MQRRRHGLSWQWGIRMIRGEKCYPMLFHLLNSSGKSTVVACRKKKKSKALKGRG